MEINLNRQLYGDDLINMYCLFKDASLFHITPSIQEISFELDEKNNLHVLIYVLKSIKPDEPEHIAIFKNNLEKNYNNEGSCFFSILKIEKKEVIYAKSLKMIFFSAFREEDYDSVEME